MFPENPCRVCASAFHDRQTVTAGSLAFHAPRCVRVCVSVRVCVCANAAGLAALLLVRPINYEATACVIRAICPSASLPNKPAPRLIRFSNLARTIMHR